MVNFWGAGVGSKYRGGGKCPTFEHRRLRDGPSAMQNQRQTRTLQAAGSLTIDGRRRHK